MDKNSIRYRAYLVCMMCALIIPLVCMTFARTDTTTENAELVAWPQMQVDGKLNVDYLKEAGGYFEDHYAFRNQLVDVNARLRTSLLGVSPTSRVVAGSSDWLYFEGTLNDYLGRDNLSDRALQNVAFNISLMQGYVQSRGAAFVFTLAPNKNSLYPQNMPYYLQKSTQASNAQRLKPYLESYGINYVDLFTAFAAARDVEYYMRDTHWNTIGAVRAYNAMLDACGIEHETYTDVPYKTREDYIGDINKILFPGSAEGETIVEYDLAQSWHYAGTASSVEGSWVETVADGENTLLMFRDSFGNALLPLMADAFEHAYFSKLVPYNLAKVDETGARCVIVERAERNLASLGMTPPVMQGPRVMLDTARVPAVNTATTVTTRKNGKYVMVEGVLDQASVAADTGIIVAVGATNASGVLLPTDVSTYCAFRTSVDTTASSDASTKSITTDEAATTVQVGDSTSDFGYCLYLEESSVPSAIVQVTIYARTEDGYAKVAQKLVDVDN